MKHLFYREGKSGKWHWHKECNLFPHGKIKEISFFFKAEGKEFCEECSELDLKIENRIEKKIA